MSYVNAHKDDRHHTLDLSDMFVTYAGFQSRCGEADTAFPNPLRQNAVDGVLVRSSETRQFAAKVGAAPYLGDLREENFYLGSSHPGFRSNGGSRRRARGRPGPGQANS